jgi:hypothetical protein
MADIFDCVKVSDNIRPRYTPYEIIYMIKEKQKQSGLSLEEFCAKYNLTLEGYEKLISYKGVFNWKIYYKCAEILEVNVDKLLEEYIDDISVSNDKTFLLANKLFNEIIIQEKIAK